MSKQALNVIDQPYDSDAVMIGRAYDYQAELGRTVGARFAYLDETGEPRGVDDVAKAYVRTMQQDRRYRLHVLSSTGDSAIVTYRGRRLYVEGVWNAVEKSRTFYVYRSN